jgi:probable rRNA maturation factor
MAAAKKPAAKKSSAATTVAQTPVAKQSAAKKAAAKKPAPKAPVAKPELSLSLQFADAAHRAELPRHKVRRWIRAALAEWPAEITVRVVGEDEGRALNHEYRGKDYATNVLTFDYAHEPVVMADLVLCAPVVEREAAELKLSVADHYAHLLVHGTLHAQGHDHEQEDEAQEMEALETQILLGLGLHDPYGHGG